MVRLREAILTITYSISLGADVGCPSGIILIDVAYKLSLSTNMSFDHMISAFKLYNPSIKDNATDGLQNNMERECTTRLATQSLIRSCKMGCRSFILKVVEDTWVRLLRDLDSFYTRFSPRDIFDLLATHNGGFDRANDVAIFATMHITM